MRVTHELQITGVCPVDGTTDVYELTVVCVDRVLPVEWILKAVTHVTQGPVFQEDITQQLADELHADVTTSGCHSSVRTQCEASPKKEESA